MNDFRKDFSLSACMAGIIATVIAYAGPLVIIIQAANAAHYSNAVLASWVGSISLGSGLLSIYLSLRYKVPVVIAWSAPGSALLVTLLPGFSLQEAIGAYIVANAIILLVGLSGAFDKIVAQLPAALTAAMLSGILLRFGTDLFVGVNAQPGLVLCMFVTYLLGKRFAPRYAVMAVLFVGCAFALCEGSLQGSPLALELTTPVWVMPSFTLHAVLNIALPLVMVALTGQFVPGLAVLRNEGYTTPARPLITSNALVSLLLSPAGCHGLNLAAITAAICTGKESHEDPLRRYVAGVASGMGYLIVGLFAATLVAFFMALPKALVATLAGLALLGAIASSLSNAMAAPKDREAALITFLATVSGMSWLGLSAAFWGLLLGMSAHWVLSVRSTPPPASAPVAAKPSPRAE